MAIAKLHIAPFHTNVEHLLKCSSSSRRHILLQNEGICVYFHTIWPQKHSDFKNLNYEPQTGWNTVRLLHQLQYKLGNREKQKQTFYSTCYTFNILVTRNTKLIWCARQSFCPVETLAMVFKCIAGLQDVRKRWCHRHGNLNLGGLYTADGHLVINSFSGLTHTNPHACIRTHTLLFLFSLDSF